MTAIRCFLQWNNVRSVTVPATVEEILTTGNRRGFFSSESIKSVTFEAGSRLRSIGEYGFCYCGATSLDLPDSLESIGDYAFADADLQSIRFGSGLKSIGAYAFQGQALRAVSLPDSIQTIGDYAFADCTSLTTLKLGSSLKSIGEFAFQNTAISSVALPDDLESIGRGAFRDCEALTGVTWPKNGQLTAVTGFEGCTNLADNDILSALPDSVTRIEDFAFTNCGFTSVAIGPKVEYVGFNAFSGCPVTALSIAPGTAELRLGAGSFAYTHLGGKTVELPARVRVLNEGAFGFIKNRYDYDPVEECDRYFGPEIHIRNRNISFVNDETYYEIWETSAPDIVQVFYDSFNAKIYYPADIDSASFTAYKDYAEGDGNMGSFRPVFLVEEQQQEPEKPVYTVTGTIPAGAAVAVVAGAKEAEVAMTGQAFSARAPEGSYVTVLVSQAGYADRSFSRTGAEFTADWALGEIELTLLAETGDLKLTTTGAGAANANVALFDDGGKLVWSGRAVGDLCVIQALTPGTYTLLAFADNPFISSVSSLGDLTALGLSADSWTTAAVTVARGATAEKSLAVPAMNTAALSALVVTPGTDVLIERAHVTPDLSFLARVSYVMADGHPAETLRVVIPAGFTVESVASYTTQYAVGTVYDAGTGLVTVTGLTGDDALRGTLFVGLKTANAGKYAVSASVTTGGAAVPAGSASFEVKAVSLELPAGRVNSRSFRASVFAAPNTVVSVQVGAGAAQNVTTNANGVWSGNLDLPAGSVYGSSTKVLASAHGAAETGDVRFTRVDDKLEELYFVHAGRQTYAVRSGSDVSGTYYTYIANGDEANKYWSFSVTIRTATPITGGVTLHVRFLDGSEREQAMSLARLTAGAGGCEQTYVATMYIEIAGDHVFDSALIPNGLYVTYTYAGQPFVLDGDAVQYVEGVAAADQGRYAQDVQTWGDPGDWTVPDEGYFGEDWTLHNEPWFAEIPAADRDVILDAEEAFADLNEAISDAFGLDKPFNEYDDPEDMLNAGGIHLDPPPGFEYDPDALRSEGFDVAEDDSFAFRDRYNENGDPEGLEYADENNRYLNIDFQDNAMDNLGDAVMAQSFSYGSMALEKLNDLRASLQSTIVSLTPSAEKAAAEAELKAIGKFGYKLKVGGAILGGIIGSIQAKKNSDDYVDQTVAVEELKGDLDILKNTIKNYYVTHGANKACIDAIDDEILAGEALLTALMSQKAYGLQDTVIGACFTAGGALATFCSGGTAAPAVAAANLAYDAGSNAAGLKRADEIARLQVAFENASAERKRRCGDVLSAGNTFSFTPILDPSGIVYEAVESNLLEGVTATAYSGAGVWDAAAYDQVNPQTTLADGAYAWDVPPGTWHVVFTKDGYNSAQTADMAVPPPHMNLKTPMVATAAPAVESANAYGEYVELVFTQYMDTVTPLTVPDGWTYAWADPVPVSDTDATAYAKVLRLTPAAAMAAGDLAAVTVSGAKNYAGTPLGDYDSGVLTVTAKPSAIQLNYADQVAVLVGEDPIPRVVATVLDEAGDPIQGLTVSASAASGIYASVAAVSAVTDANGAAVFSVNGLLPGLTSLTLSVDGTALTKTIPLRVTVDSNRVARPTATVGATSIGAGAPKDNYVTVTSGSTLTLESATPGATIYYTTNDTCPCQSADRTVYTGPVTLTEDTYFRVSAYKNGMEYSERLNIHVTVNPAGTGGGAGGGTGGGPDTEKAPGDPFVDVHKDDFFYDAVLWAVENGITDGTSDTTFSPCATCTRAQTVTFLWRAAGCPEPKSAVDPFTDVKPTDYFCKAVLWAVENGITDGTSDTTFSPGRDVTREQCVTFLYRLQGVKTGAANPFRDVSAADYSYDAVLWAYESGITDGTSATTFSPDSDCLRGQVVTFLYRCFA